MVLVGFGRPWKAVVECVLLCLIDVFMDFCVCWEGGRGDILGGVAPQYSKFLC